MTGSEKHGCRPIQKARDQFPGAGSKLSCDDDDMPVICPTGQRLYAAVRFSPSCRISAIVAMVQNSLGPRRSSLASQVSSVAATLMSTIPAMLTAACMAKLP
jgi:hypothetical protein